MCCQLLLAGAGGLWSVRLCLTNSGSDPLAAFRTLPAVLLANCFHASAAGVRLGAWGKILPAQGSDLPISESVGIMGPMGTSPGSCAGGGGGGA